MRVFVGGGGTILPTEGAELEAIGAGWLISVGRGSVVDESALVPALDDEETRGQGNVADAENDAPMTVEGDTRDEEPK